VFYYTLLSFATFFKITNLHFIRFILSGVNESEELSAQGGDGEPASHTTLNGAMSEL
jgi:hypothetical protein